jgi:4-hydroxythreonine-4-phosphate dehydrogenase
VKPLLISSGEPAGIGPDLCLALVNHPYPLVILADPIVLAARAKQLGLNISYREYEADAPWKPIHNTLTVLSQDCPYQVTPGVLNPKNAGYVLQLLEESVKRCLSQEFLGVVTAPVHKAVINDAGYAFTGHTEFFANACDVPRVVMLLMSKKMKVALVTTHLPLRSVADSITRPLLTDVIRMLHRSLQDDFGIARPKIYVAGLNPHAGEGGHLGFEELDVIIPVLDVLRREGMEIAGPFSADTLFTPAHQSACDAFLTMYHDQGLPVLKHASFGQAVNVTLGLPMIRTSVDHGTALSLAGTGRVDSGSMLAAVDVAVGMAKQREKHVV